MSSSSSVSVDARLGAVGSRIDLDDVHRAYQVGATQVVALDDINLHVDEAAFVVVLGASGSGKTTLLNMIGALDTPTSGTVGINGEDITHASREQRRKIRRGTVSFIFQSFNLIDELNVAENIELALLYHDMPGAERKRRVAEVMDKMGIAHRAKHMPGQLSGGQQQRVAVARAVVGDQPLILADEPTGNLDSAHGQEVMEMLRTLNNEGTTIVMVTHSPAHADYARRTVNLFDGHVVTDAMRAA